MDRYGHRRRAAGTTPRGLRPRWDVPTGGDVRRGGPAFVGSDQVVVHLSGPGREGRVLALAVADGRRLWEHRLERGSSAGPAVDGDLVVSGDAAGRVVGLDAHTGDLRWEVTLSGPLQGRALIVDDRVVVGIGRSFPPHGAGGVAVISRDGVSAGEVVMGSAVAAPPTAFDDDHVLVGTVEGTVHVVDPRALTVRDLVVPAESGHDEVDLPIVGSPITSPVLRLPGHAVVAAGGTVAAVDDDGRLSWSWDAGRAVLSELAFDGARVLIPGADGRLLALDATSGAPRWHVERLGPREPGIWSTPVVVGDVALAIGSRGVLVGVHTESGEELLELTIDQEPVGATLDGDPGGRVVVAGISELQRLVCWELTA